MDIVSILSLGTVGLGFLLAFLAFRLLSNGKSNERPIYIFMIFCLVLVAVGAALQFYGGRDASDISRRDRHIADLEKQLADTRNQTSNQKLSISNSMKGLVEALDRTSEPMMALTNHITDPNVCPGDNDGQALPNVNLDSARITSIVAEISTAKQTAKQYVQQ